MHRTGIAATSRAGKTTAWQYGLHRNWICFFLNTNLLNVLKRMFNFTVFTFVMCYSGYTDQNDPAIQSMWNLNESEYFLKPLYSSQFDSRAMGQWRIGACIKCTAGERVTATISCMQSALKCLKSAASLNCFTVNFSIRYPEKSSKGSGSLRLFVCKAMPVAFQHCTVNKMLMMTICLSLAQQRLGNY